MVFAQVRLHNQSKAPLFLINIITNATLDDGIHSSYAATTAITTAYSGLSRMPVPHGKALHSKPTIDPGQTVEGTFVSAFKMNKQQWDARQGA